LPRLTATRPRLNNNVTNKAVAFNVAIKAIEAS
jgi:hypothetical protein